MGTERDFVFTVSPYSEQKLRELRSHFDEELPFLVERYDSDPYLTISGVRWGSYAEDIRLLSQYIKDVSIIMVIQVEAASSKIDPLGDRSIHMYSDGCYIAGKGPLAFSPETMIETLVGNS